jgi:serine/threonine-protein kinase
MNQPPRPPNASKGTLVGLSAVGDLVPPRPPAASRAGGEQSNGSIPRPAIASIPAERSSGAIPRPGSLSGERSSSAIPRPGSLSGEASSGAIPRPVSLSGEPSSAIPQPAPFAGGAVFAAEVGEFAPASEETGGADLVLSDHLAPPVPSSVLGERQGSLSEMSGENSVPVPSAPGSIPPPPSKQDPYIGVTIDGRYKVESVLGEGGMGVVYAGRHKVINKRVAIKVLRGEMSRDREMTDRFLQEARAASSIGHPHIADVSDFGELPDGSAYFVMEFLEGRGLSALMNESKPIPTKRLIHIAKQVADALHAAHSLGIVHRDLKPDNVFIVNRGMEKDFVKILDFGIAKVSTSNTAKLTRAGTVFGTPHYMSPEQAAGAPVDHRTDIYALGVIMYEMGTGRVPFDADNYMGILTQHMYKAPVPIRMLVPVPTDDMPPGLEAIILKCLSKKAEQRYEDMAVLIEDLNRLERGELPLAVSEMMARSGAFNVPADYFSSPTISQVTSATPMTARPRWGLFAGGTGIVAAVALVVGILSRGNSSPAQTSPTTTTTTTTTTAATTAPTPSAAVTAAPASKQVLVDVTPDAAEVFVGDRRLGNGATNVEVAAGQKVTIEIKAVGYTPQTVTLDGSEGKLPIKLAKANAGKPGVGGVGKGLPNTSAPTTQPTGGRKPPGGDIVDPWAKPK